MPLANCAIDTLSTAAKCFDCLSQTEKNSLKIVFMAAALKQAGGPDLTNMATRRATVQCFACEPDPRLESMQVAIWLSLAQSFGAVLPTDIASLRALANCSGCGEQKSNRAAFVYLLCQLSATVLP